MNEGVGGLCPSGQCFPTSLTSSSPTNLCPAGLRCSPSLRYSVQLPSGFSACIVPHVSRSGTAQV